MPTVTVYPVSHDVVQGTWNNPTRLYADDSSYTTVSPTYDVEDYVEVVFSPCNIPTGSVINSVAVETQFHFNTGSAAIVVGLQAMYNGANVGTCVYDTTAPTIDKIITNTTGTWTIAKLNDGKAGAYILAYYYDSPWSGTVYFDYVRMTVDYTPPAPQNYTKSLLVRTTVNPTISRIRSYIKSLLFATSITPTVTKKTSKNQTYKSTILGSVGKKTSKNQTYKSTILGSVGKKTSKWMSIITSASSSFSLQALVIFQKALEVVVSASSSVFSRSLTVARKVVTVSVSASSSFIFRSLTVARKVVTVSVSVSSSVLKKIFKTLVVNISGHFTKFWKKIDRSLTAIKRVVLQVIIRDKTAEVIERKKTLDASPRIVETELIERKTKIEAQERKVETEVIE